MKESKDPAKVPASGRPRWLAPALAGLVAVAAVGGVVWSNQERAEDRASDGAPRPLDESDLRQALAAKDVDAGALVALLEPDAAIAKFAAGAAPEGSHVEVGQALIQAIRERAAAQAFVPWYLGEPRSSPVQVAKDVLKAVQKDGARARLYPLEVAALAVASLRSRGLWAMVAELHDEEDAKQPLDPSGYLGYFGVALYQENGGDKAPKLFDPYGGRTLPVSMPHTVIDDPTAIGAALSLRAVYEMGDAGDPKRAIERSSAALRLSPRLPSVRTTQGVLMLGSKMIEQGLSEFEAAVQLRRDAARLHNLASLMLATGEPEKAERNLAAALAEAPEFAAAIASRGGLHLLRGELDEAQADLERAERLAPDFSQVQWALAELSLRRGDGAEGLARARRAFDLRPSFEAHLRYGMLLRQVGRYDEMRAVAAKMLAAAPSSRRGALRELVMQAMGPTALEGVDGDSSAKGGTDLAEPGVPAAAVPNLDAPDLELGGPQPPALGGAAGGRLRPGADDGPKLRLRGDGQQLKLNLGD